MCLALRCAGAYDRVAVRLLGTNTPTNFPLWMGEQDQGEEEDKREEEEEAGDKDTDANTEQDVKDEKVEASGNGGTPSGQKKTRGPEGRL